jgi:hypothetical protein
VTAYLPNQQQKVITGAKNLIPFVNFNFPQRFITSHSMSRFGVIPKWGEQNIPLYYNKAVVLVKLG